MSLITVLIIKNSIVFRKYTQRCSGVKGHHVCNLLSNGFTNNNSNMDTDREWRQRTVKCEHLGICRKSMQGCFALHFPNFPRSLRLFQNLKINSFAFFFFLKPRIVGSTKQNHPNPKLGTCHCHSPSLADGAHPRQTQEVEDEQAWLKWYT